MATYYLNADTGNDTTGDGSSGNPWLTVSKAHTSASNGDTVILQDSVASYSFATLVHSKSIDWQGEQLDGSGAVLDGSNASRTWTITGALVSFKNMIIQNVGNGVTGAQFVINSAIVVAFQNVIFDHMNAGQQYYEGSFQVGSTAVVSFLGCLWKDMYLPTGGTLNESPVFSLLTSAPALTFTNCTIYFSGDYAAPTAFLCGAGAPAGSVTTMRNTIAYNNTGSTIDLHNPFASSPTVNVSYCCNYLMSSVPAGTGNITSDPLFVDAANNNLNLQPASPCVNTGTLL